MRTLRGIIGPVTTPFQRDGTLDRMAFEANITTHVAAGLQGIVVCGSTGEAPLLDGTERDALVEWARPHLDGDRVLVAGTGAESTRMTLAHTKRAADRGADAALVVAPHYYGAMSADALRAHYERLADDSPIPIVLYNIPKYMHFKLPPEVVADLARHENIAGIKDSSGDRELLAGYLRAQSDTFTVLTGSGQLFRTALAMGARGGILGVSLFAAELTQAVRDAVERRDDAAADELQARLTPLAREIVGELGVPGVKAALDSVGLRGGPPRPPLQPLGRGDEERVRKLLSDAELSVAA